MKLLKCIAVFFIASTMLCSCAANRVSPVETKNDALSLYRVPVVYGIGISKDSKNLKWEEGSMGFGEYDPKTQKGTASCLGTADEIRIYASKEKIKESAANGIYYGVLMVPPGYYAMSWGVKPHEANPSIYFKIEPEKPQYLGDFRIGEKPQAGLLLKHAYSEPVTYNVPKAIQALKKFDIPSDNLKKIDLLPTKGATGAILCTP